MFALIKSQSQFERIFLEMWGDDNEERMYELGVNSCKIPNGKAMVTAFCVHYLNIPYTKFKELASSIPELNESSFEYQSLKYKVDGGSDIMAMCLIQANLVIERFNSEQHKSAD